MQTKATSPKGIPLALIVVGVAMAIGMPGLTGLVIGAVIANVGLAAWLGCVVMTPVATPARRAWARRGTRVRVGDYVASERDLYRIERVGERSVEVEDCRTGELIELASEDCARLKVVKRAQPSGASSRSNSVVITS